MSSPISAWSHASQERVQTILDSYPEPRSAIMPLLYIASLEHDRVSPEAMRQVAELTGVTPAQVASVASFYTMFKRDGVGEYLVSVCTSISCFLRGADDVLEVVEDATGARRGETSSDGTFTVEHVECIGSCGGAPAVQVNYELIEGVSTDNGRKLVAWLKDTKPQVVLADEMQQLFGGSRSFDWGGPEPEGAIAPVPAFGPYGSSGEGR
ncbi:MAG: NAD(P)H-dependent oxidoreductase subunit E [Actinomycetia bacterium]|nr:NAD(P)H-dependent oxidoreductase subunit E [Actinomycetes bacterium]